MDAPRARLRVLEQADAYSSPWSVGTRLRVLLWRLVWLFLFRPTPKPFYAWRVFLLRLFGSRVKGKPFVASSAVVKMPWNLALDDRACLGPKSEVYNLAMVSLGARCVVAQEAYLCAGTHDFSDARLPLVVGEITVGADAFIGARAFVHPGVRIEDGAVVGACSVVTKDVPAWTIAAGNPCTVLKSRQFRRDEARLPGPSPAPQ